MEPIEWIVIIAAIIGAAASAGTAVYSAQQASKAADHNAKVAAQQALAAQQKAAFEEKLRRKEGRDLKARQVAAAGASGATLGSFSALFAQTEADTELDALAIRYSGQIESMQSKNQAGTYKLEGSQAKQAGYVSAGSSLLTSASKSAAGTQ